MLPPFKFFALQSFPFIEYDFDAMTNYELMCKIAEYLKTVANKTNENTTDIQNLISWIENLNFQEEVDNKLDEMASDGTLAEIINQQIFNELNTIVQHDTILVNDELKIYAPYRGQNAGDCFVIQNSDKNILIDLGTSISPLITWLSNKGITKLDYIILSHYHGDHIAGDSATGFITLLDSQVIDTSDCIVYLPHKGIDWSQVITSDKSTIMANESTIKSALTQRNIEYIEPNNLQLLVLSQICNLKFMNIGSSYYNSYYGLTSNEYNNFSMVVEITHNNRHALFTGDICKEAQNNVASLIYEPDIFKAPHHDLEPIASESFLHKITSKIMIFMEWFDYYGSGLTTQFSQAIKNNGGKIYDTNVSQNISIILKNDNIISNSDNGVFSLQSDSVLNASGIHIPLNTDLNNLITNGNYYTNNNAETLTLGHLPMSTEYSYDNWDEDLGRCKVINMSLNMYNEILIQYFMVSTSGIWVRVYNNNVWSSWSRISDNGLFSIGDNFIPANSNLNNILSPGKYLIVDNSVYNTIDNIPVADQGGSILLVLHTRLNTNLIHQILLCATGNTYKRVIEMNERGTATQNIGNWVKITTESVT